MKALLLLSIFVQYIQADYLLASVSTAAGNENAGLLDGQDTLAKFNGPLAVSVDSGNIYVADELNNAIRKIDSNSLVSTVAGSGVAGFADGQGRNALLYHPFGITVGTTGQLYVSDSLNHKIRKISNSGLVTTLAGTNAGYLDGPVASASFNQPSGIVFDSAGNLFVSDSGNNRIRKVFLSAMVYSIAGNLTLGYNDGLFCNATFSLPKGLALDSSGNLYVADRGNNVIRKITTAGMVSTVGGNGTLGYVNGLKSSATLNSPISVAVDSNGNLFVCDYINHVIRKITPDGQISTFAGNGTAATVDGYKNLAKFNYPHGIAIDQNNNMYVTEYSGHVIRRITPDGFVTTIAGNGVSGFADGNGKNAQFNFMKGIAVDSNSNVFVADYNNHRIRKIETFLYLATFAGNGVAGFADNSGLLAQFNSPVGIAVDSVGNVFVADRNNHRIRKITPSGLVSTIAGSGVAGYIDAQGTSAQFDNPIGLAIDSNDNLYVSEYSQRIRRIDSTGTVSTIAGTGNQGSQDGPANSASFWNPSQLSVTLNGTILITDTLNHKIRKISPSGQVSTIAGTGTSGFSEGAASSAQFNSPTDAVSDSLGNVFVVDGGNHVIRKIDVNGQVSTFAGTPQVCGFADGQGTAAKFCSPQGLIFDSAGNMYVGDAGNYRIRKITQSGLVSTFAGDGTLGSVDGALLSAKVDTPTQLAIGAGGQIFFSDGSNNIIRKITVSCTVSTMAGNGTRGFNDGQGTLALINYPRSIGVDYSGNVYFIDQGNSALRKILPSGLVTTLAGNGTEKFLDGKANAALLDSPSGFAVDPQGQVYFTDNSNNIRKFTPENFVNTFAGGFSKGLVDGIGTGAQFNSQKGLAIDSNDNLYVADTLNHAIRLITPNGTVYTIAGNGTAGFSDGLPNQALFNSPLGVALDTNGRIFVADTANHRLCLISNTVSTLAGNGSAGFSDGIGSVARFSSISGVSIGSNNTVYLSDYANNRIRKATIINAADLPSNGHSLFNPLCFIFIFVLV